MGKSKEDAQKQAKKEAQHKRSKQRRQPRTT